MYELNIHKTVIKSLEIFGSEFKKQAITRKKASIIG